MIFLLIAFFFIFKKTFKFNRFKQALKNREIITFSKSNLYKWMNLTKKERYYLSKKESTSYLNKRNVLLEKIRKEYKKVSKTDSNNT